MLLFQYSLVKSRFLPLFGSLVSEIYLNCCSPPLGLQHLRSSHNRIERKTQPEEKIIRFRIVSLCFLHPHYNLSASEKNCFPMQNTCRWFESAHFFLSTCSIGKEFHQFSSTVWLHLVSWRRIIAICFVYETGFSKNENSWIQPFDEKAGLDPLALLVLTFTCQQNVDQQTHCSSSSVIEVWCQVCHSWKGGERV